MNVNSPSRRRAVSFRLVGWLAVATMLALALLGPAAGGALASNEPGSPDFLPASGDHSSDGLTLTMAQNATISCDQDSVNSISGSFEFTGTGTVVVYLTPNNGSNASPAGNVDKNQVTIDLTGKTSPVAFTINITSAFTESKGGILAVFARGADTVYHSKSNSLNCEESTPSTAPPSEEPSTAPPSEEPSTAPPSEEPSTAPPSGSVEPSSEAPSGSVEAQTGRPHVTPPSTSTDLAGTSGSSSDSWRIALFGMGILLGSLLLLAPSRKATRRR